MLPMVALGLSGVIAVLKKQVTLGRNYFAPISDLVESPI